MLGRMSVRAAEMVVAIQTFRSASELVRLGLLNLGRKCKMCSLSTTKLSSLLHSIRVVDRGMIDMTTVTRLCKGADSPVAKLSGPTILSEPGWAFGS